MNRHVKPRQSDSAEKKAAGGRVAKGIRLDHVMSVGSRKQKYWHDIHPACLLHSDSRLLFVHE
jgi:hypothetical protein